MQALRQQGPARIVIAVPTAAADSCDMLEPMVDDMVVLTRPAYFHAVGQWYEDFSQTTDAEVRRLLSNRPATGLAVRQPGGNALGDYFRAAAAGMGSLEAAIMTRKPT